VDQTKEKEGKKGSNNDYNPFIGGCDCDGSYSSTKETGRKGETVDHDLQGMFPVNMKIHPPPPIVLTTRRKYSKLVFDSWCVDPPFINEEYRRTNRRLLHFFKIKISLLVYDSTNE
jgi:hypothetical protein